MREFVHFPVVTRENCSRHFAERFLRNYRFIALTRIGDSLDLERRPFLFRRLESDSKNFTFEQVDEYGPRGQGVPLEILYNRNDDNSDPRHPKF